MRRLARCALVPLLVAAAPVLADVTLPGYQHIGDGSNSSFTPADPVKRAQMQSNPTHFYLSQAATVTAIQLTDENDLNNKLQIFIDDMNTALSGTLSGSCNTGGTCTYTLSSSMALSAGSHTIWPDGGCSSGTTFASSCGSNGENDFGFSSIVLVSSAASVSRSEHRRRHLGDNSESSSSTKWYAGRWYPDSPDGSSASISFSLDISRELSEIRFWNLRDISSSALSKPTVKIDGTTIGTLTGNASPFILSSGAVLAAGSHTLTVTVGSNTSSDLDDFSWDDTVMVFVNNPATTPGAFNAVDTGGDAASGTIQTRTAGATATVDLVAVSGGAQFTTYTGTVNVYLLDASTTTGVDTAGTNCDAGWVTLSSLGSTTFVSGDSGRKAFTFSYADALANARLLLTDTSLNVTGCSTDNFAIKPDHFGNITVSHDNQKSSGTTESLATSGFTVSTTPIHNAGRPFTVQATAYNALGAVTPSYAGSPTLSAYATISGMGNTLGVASSGGSWSRSGGTVTTSNATYNEVGAVTLQLVDTTFAAVDAGDTAVANRQIGPSTFDVGRFVPDHFTFTPVVDAQFAAGCGTGSNAYTYMGQPFYFTSTPSADVTAVDANGNTTTNYDGTLYKLTVSPQSTYSLFLTDATYPANALVSPPTFDTTRVPNPDNSFVNQGNGVSLYTVIPPLNNAGYELTRGNTPLVPVQADIAIALNYTDTDGVTFDNINSPGRFGSTASSGQGIPFALGGVSGTGYNQFRYGRLAVDSTQGSERQPLSVPLRAEYYYESSTTTYGWATNLLDSGSSSGCTSSLLSLTSFNVDPDSAGSTSATALPTMASGATTLTLSTPNVSEQVRLTAQISGTLPWLQTGASYNQDPTAVETFGLFKNEDRRIFQREVIGP